LPRSGGGGNDDRCTVTHDHTAGTYHCANPIGFWNGFHNSGEIDGRDFTTSKTSHSCFSE
jgi:hypothetical protein